MPVREVGWAWVDIILLPTSFERRLHIKIFLEGWANGEKVFKNLFQANFLPASSQVGQAE